MYDNRHHHGNRHGVRQSYGNFAQRLEGLAQTFGTKAPAPVATGSVADSSIQPPPAAVLSPVETAVAEPVAADVAVAKPPKNALLEAFSKLYAALSPPDVDAATDADMAAKMRLFLHALAQALRPDLMIEDHAPQVGGLVDVTA